MGAKQNMKRAVRELIGLPGAGEPEKPAENPEEKACKQAVIRTVEEILGAGAAEENPEETPEETPKETPEEQPEEVGAPPEGAVIAAGITILGDIRTAGDLDFRGVLRGDLAAAGDVVLSGRVLGNVSGRNVAVRRGTVQGDVTAADAVEVGEDAVLLGGVTAQTMTLKGRQKGSVRVEKFLTLGGKAVLVGDVTAFGISMAEGARVQLGGVVSRGGGEFPAFEELEL